MVTGEAGVMALKVTVALLSMGLALLSIYLSGPWV